MGVTAFVIFVGNVRQHIMFTATIENSVSLMLIIILMITGQEYVNVVQRLDRFQEPIYKAVTRIVTISARHLTGSQRTGSQRTGSQRTGSQRTGSQRTGSQWTHNLFVWSNGGHCIGSASIVMPDATFTQHIICICINIMDYVI